jgi:amino acid transporter
MIAWLLADALSLPLALLLIELSSMFPTAGGPYVYKYYALKRLVPGLGELLGFLTGWLFWVSIIVGLACMSNGLCYSMAQTKLFPRQFAYLDEETQVPAYSLWFQSWCVTIIGVTANLCSRLGIFADAYAFLGDTFGFMYAFVATLYGVCLISLRYTELDLPRPFRIGGFGNLGARAMTAITGAVWGYAALGCVGRTEQLTGVLILLAGVPISAYYKHVNGCSQAEED